MIIKDLRKCKEITAGDNTNLRELLNPLRDKINIGYSVAHARVKTGEVSFKHRLKSSEVYYILKGKGKMKIDDEEMDVRPGHVVYIPPDAVQQIANSGKKELSFICIVEPAWKFEDEEVYK